jgi:hypothetical protein
MVPSRRALLVGLVLCFVVSTLLFLWLVEPMATAHN